MMQKMMLGLGACALLSGCGSAPTSAERPVDAGLDAIVVTEEAPSAQNVAELRANRPEEGAEVAVAGRIKDFVGGVAVFTLVDGSLPPFEEGEEEDHCEPYASCCVAPEVLRDNSATVFIGSRQWPLMAELKGTLGLDVLTSVVVQARAYPDDEGNLALEASKVYILAP